MPKCAVKKCKNSTLKVQKRMEYHIFNLHPRCSFHGDGIHKETLQSETSWSSDVNISTKSSVKQDNNDRFDQWYLKKYEHDLIPVKDEVTLQNVCGDNIHKNPVYSSPIPLTNSELQKLESKIYENISQDLNIGDSSVKSLESNVKNLKYTIQEILDFFYTNMKGLEIDKKRFDEILARSQEDPVFGTKDCIIDMIQQIMSSEVSISDEGHKSKLTPDIEIRENDFHRNASYRSHEQKAQLIQSIHSLIESYKNDNYLTDSTDYPSKFKDIAKKEDICNIFLQGDVPCVQIKMNNRNILSEINIRKEPGSKILEQHVASADNFMLLADKRLQMNEDLKQIPQVQDKEIPIKVSCAKRNIPLDADFINEQERNKSFISKICGYICKKFRKNM